MADNFDTPSNRTRIFDQDGRLWTLQDINLLLQLVDREAIAKMLTSYLVNGTVIDRSITTGEVSRLHKIIRLLNPE